MSDPVTPYIEAIRGPAAKDPANPPVRMELRDMYDQHPKMWELYVLGLQRFQDLDKDEPLSYFQIAGIHGIPFQKWPNESWNTDMEPKDGNTQRGFCTHSSILFLPWHRPYLALFEHELWKQVQAIASEPPYSNDPAYAEAAANFRIPYWDWADPARDIFPDLVLQSTPGSKLFPGSKLDRNPLAAYPFPPSVGKEFKVLNYPRTVRYANRDYVEGGLNEQDEKQQREDLLRYLKNPQLHILGNNVTERTAFVLKSYTQYRPMSCDYLAEDNNDRFENYGSLEDSHNMIHDWTGGTGGKRPNFYNRGQMSDTKYSSFDPIFWLHHTNIDRLFAIWQALHPDSYVEPPTMNGDAVGTWSHGISEEDEETSLTPFFKDSKSSFWTSTDVKATSTFGYTYPELQGSPTKAEILERVDTLYPSGSTATLISRKNNIAAKAVSNITARAAVHKAVASAGAGTTAQQVVAAAPTAIQQVVLPRDRSIEDIVSDNKYIEWLVNIRARKHAMEGHYAVHVFLGAPDDTDPLSYVLSPKHISLFSPFGQSSDTGCGKCKDDQDAGLVITGQIPLTIALLERYLAGQLPSFQVEDVTRFLQEHLHWRVINNRGVLVPPSDVRDLLLAVVTNEVTLPTDPTGQPTYSTEVVPRPEITTKQDGVTGRGAGTGLTSS